MMFATRIVYSLMKRWSLKKLYWEKKLATSWEQGALAIVWLILFLITFHCSFKIKLQDKFCYWGKKNAKRTWKTNKQKQYTNLFRWNTCKTWLPLCSPSLYVHLLVLTMRSHLHTFSFNYIPILVSSHETTVTIQGSCPCSVIFLMHR